METKFKFKQVVIVKNEKSPFYGNSGVIEEYGKTLDAGGTQVFFYKVFFFWPLPNPLAPRNYTKHYLFYENELDVLPPGDAHLEFFPPCPYPPVPQKHPEMS